MPYHEFIVGEQVPLDVSWNENGIVINGLEVAPQASIDDDLINYLSDSLVWIKTLNPNESVHRYGLDRYGLTIIRDKENLVTFKNIISSWINLFQNAPSELTLTGNYGWTVGSNSGQYEKISFKRLELLESLNKLIEVVDIALKLNQCVIHFGI